MNNERLEKLYPVIEKMAIWDESRERMLKKATVNGCTEEEAEYLYKKARASRISELRRDALTQMVQGAIVLFFTLGCIYYLVKLSPSVGAFQTRMAAPFGLAAALGLFRALQGMVGWTYAPRKTGSLADDE
ncbi:MAG: hypothetical protein Q7Q71_07365 [Verrucomicrobiota bacterium JB023]|nr:hypothetical protein [Verrucomicrobiota bacterium JB023]